MRRRIVLSILVSLGIVLCAVGLVSYLATQEGVELLLEDHLKLATIIANDTDTLLENNLVRLYDISISGLIDFSDGDMGPEERSLRRAYEYSVFTDGVFLLDRAGTVLLSYPGGRRKDSMLDLPNRGRVLLENRPLVSNIFTDERTGRKGIFVLVPLTDKTGSVVGAAGGEINPTNYILNRVLRTIPVASSAFIELVDSAGFVIASNYAERVFTCTDHNRILGAFIEQKQATVTTCHRCHEGAGGVAETSEKTDDMLAFAPLRVAGWGVAVREPEADVFAPIRGLKRKFLLVGLISMASLLVLTLGISQGIIKPIERLIQSTQKIAAGNLDDPILVTSEDELGALSEGLEQMRLRLSESLESIRRHNVELEQRVRIRTRELEQNRKRLSILLQEVITAQEEERKRIARELHDETSQSLAALGMSVDIAEIALNEGALGSVGINELRLKVNQLLEGIHHLIRDLRPPILDDLGLESAVTWLMERHLGSKGIDYELITTDGFRRLISEARSGAGTADNGKMELILFRVVQESLINIVKHASASHVFVLLGHRENNISIWIEDNGQGFDVEATLSAPERGDRGGFGILGMRERMALLGGTCELGPNEEQGSFVLCECPVSCFNTETWEQKESSSRTTTAS